MRCKPRVLYHVVRIAHCFGRGKCMDRRWTGPRCGPTKGRRRREKRPWNLSQPPGTSSRFFSRLGEPFAGEERFRLGLSKGYGGVCARDQRQRQRREFGLGTGNPRAVGPQRPGRTGSLLGARGGRGSCGAVRTYDDDDLGRSVPVVSAEPPAERRPPRRPPRGWSVRRAAPRSASAGTAAAEVRSGRSVGRSVGRPASKDGVATSPCA
jgi:hypothetical protein